MAFRGHTRLSSIARDYLPLFLAEESLFYASEAIQTISIASP